MATILNTSGAITIRLKTNASNQAAGFKINVTCRTACQRINAMIDAANCIPPLVQEEGILYANLCEGQSLHLVGYGDYIDNNLSYAQTDAQTVFNWYIGAGSVLAGQGTTTLDYGTFYYGQGYEVKLFLTDQENCKNNNSAIVRVRTSVNPIRNITTLPDICSGNDVNLSVGYNSNAVINVDAIESIQQSSLSFDSVTYIPDGPNWMGNGCSAVNYYEAGVTFTSFTPSATLENVNDFLSVCITMEHSYIGDIKAELICPNASSAVLFPNGNGSSKHLGVPNECDGTNSSCTPSSPGTGWNYCWSQATNQGYTYATGTGSYIYNAPTHSVAGYYSGCSGSGSVTVIDSTNRVNNTNYMKPTGNFSTLLGCPLNGLWKIRITDNLGIDDGYIFNWQLNLSENLLPTPWSYTVLIDEVIWSGPNIESTSDTTAVIHTPGGGTFNYTFSVIDEYQCAYDSTITLTVVPSPEFDLGETQSICSGNVVNLDPNYHVPGAVYHWNTNSTDSVLTVITPGIYCLTITQSNGNIICNSNDCIEVEIYPQPTLNITATPSEGCDPLFVQFNSIIAPSGLTLTYSWDFGDPNTNINTSTEANPSHIYTESGSYGVNLYVITSDGCSAEVYFDNFVTVYPTPIANFTANPNEVSLSDNPNVVFTNTTENFIPGQTFWNWTFGDGGYSTEQNPTYTYTSPDDFTVTLIVTTQFGCGDTITMIIPVEDEIYIPNIITPDGDGINDQLIIGNINTARENILKIYDRWGRKVYEKENYLARAKCTNMGNGLFSCSELQDVDLGWNGDGLADGVYFYTFLYKGIVKEIQKHGSITVIGSK